MNEDPIPHPIFNGRITISYKIYHRVKLCTIGIVDTYGDKLVFTMVSLFLFYFILLNTQ